MPLTRLGINNLADRKGSAITGEFLTDLEAMFSDLDATQAWVVRPTGTNDHVAIQAAIDAAHGAGGGVVLLDRGAFDVGAKILIKRNVWLRGSGFATELTASASWNNTGSAMIVADRNLHAIDRCRISHMALEGNKGGSAVTSGVHIDGSTETQANANGEPDPHVIVDHLYISRMAEKGIHVEGIGARATKVDNVRVRLCDGIGVHVDSPDSHYSNLDVGGCGSDATAAGGITISGTNNVLNASKAWFSNGSGFVVTPTGVRTRIVGCEAQDNLMHGFYLAGSMSVAQAILADSNSYDDVTANGNQGVYDGVHVINPNQQIQGQAWDKNEGGRGLQQRYGLYFGAGATGCQVDMLTGNGGSHTNHTGSHAFFSTFVRDTAQRIIVTDDTTVSSYGY